MFINLIRRFCEKRGYALLPWAQFAEMTAARQELTSELEQMRRSRDMVADELAAVRNRQRTQADEHQSLRVACALRDALSGGLSGPVGEGATDTAALQDRLIARLHKADIPVRPDEPVFLHVGFGHAGTTSLQLNFFNRRPDLFYLGTPYTDAGGFFSYLKYGDDHLLNEQQMLEWCRNFAYSAPRREGRPIVISDETFSDTSEVYYAPRHLPGDLVAARLKRYFPTARVVFTIRQQLDYISSMYFNLKRNYAFLAGMPLPEFNEWWAGMHTQIRCPYLQNLDYSQLIDVYCRLFGRENVLILPLEELKTHGARRYLERLCQFMNLELHERDVADFSVPRNERMTVVESRLAEVITAGSSEWASVVRSLLDRESMAGLVANAPRLSIRFDDEQLRDIRRVVARGNQKLAEDFHLPLGEMGYLV